MNYSSIVVEQHNELRRRQNSVLPFDRKKKRQIINQYMADTFNKKEREKKKSQRKKEKQARKESRKDNPNEGGWESMLAYVDENGVIRDTPPDPAAKKDIKASNIEIGIPRREEEEDADPTITGTISFYDSAKGYGFIKAGRDESYFVHRNNMTSDPSVGQKVRFEKEKGPRGWVAVRVTFE